MFSTDPTHLRRYFTTLGVAIAAGTLSLAGLFLKLQQDLLVPQSTLAKLTPTARNALLRRQDYLSLGTTILPWFVLVGFLSGIGLTIYGMAGWAKRQRVIDEREDIELYKERAELRQLTDAEKADKLDRDAKESAKESAPESPSTTPPSPSANWTNIRTEIATIEGALLTKLREIYNPEDVLSGVRVGAGSGYGFEVDAAVMHEGKFDPIIFELKYASTPKNATNRIMDGLQQLARATSVVKGRGALVIVVSDDATPMQIENWTGTARKIAAEYRSLIGIYIGRHSDFMNLPAKEFATKLGLPNPPSN
jgi:hypothetical protein